MDPSKPSSPHPKIKPILVQRLSPGKNKNEKNLQKRSPTSAKEFTLTKACNLTKHFTKTLTSQQKPSKLEYELHLHELQSLRQRFPTTITHFFSKIKTLQSLTIFNLQAHQVILSKRNFYLKPLLMSLTSLKNLSNLSMMFFTTHTKDPEWLKIIFKYLKRIKTLKDLTVSFRNSRRNLSTSYIDIFSSGLSKLRQLHSLELLFCSLFTDSHYFINQLTLALPKLHFLTKIDIRFNESSEVADITPDLFLCFSKMKALSDITLVLQSAWTNYVNDPISQGLSLLDHSRIRKLHLHPYHHFDSDCLVQLSRVLKNFTSLQTLQIVLTSHRLLEEEGPTALFSTLSSLVSLSSLTIILLLKYEDKEIVERISVLCKSLKNLVSLQLQFEGSAFFHEQGIQQLFSNIRLLKSVRFLTLNCPLPEINNQHLETLGETLKELPQLQNLSLDFSSTDLLTNDGFEALTSGILTLKNLSGFTLRLQANSKLDNKTVDHIIRILQNLENLYSVDFCLGKCPQMTDFDGFFRALRRAGIGEVALTLPDEAMGSLEIIHLVENKIMKRMANV